MKLKPEKKNKKNNYWKSFYFFLAFHWLERWKHFMHVENCINNWKSVLKQTWQTATPKNVIYTLIPFVLGLQYRLISWTQAKLKLVLHFLREIERVREAHWSKNILANKSKAMFNKRFKVQWKSSCEFNGFENLCWFCLKQQPHQRIQITQRVRCSGN